MFSLKDFVPRAYQENIVQRCKEKNVLVVMPTGVGKTGISMMVALDRLNKFPDSKVVICSPTKPLCQQHVKTFIEHTDIGSGRIILYTGNMQPEIRKKFWNLAKVIVATPQTIQSDIENKRVTFDDVALLVIDEAHRSRMRFANTVIARMYMESSSPMKHILALTASPGHTKEKVKEICENLFIEDVEIRTEDDEDVKEYIQKREYEVLEVEFPKELQGIHAILKEVAHEKVRALSKVGFNKPVSIVSKKDLLLLQKRLQQEIRMKKPSAFFGLSLVAQALKVDYAMELLETQGVEQSLQYLSQLEFESSKAAKAICSDERIKNVRGRLESFVQSGQVHPKVAKLKEILIEVFARNKNARAIVFANYRATVESLRNVASTIPYVVPVVLMGQKGGVTQKHQLETLEKFEAGKYNVLLATSIGEEGLSIGGLDVAIFYDHVASAIRRIQRSGRVARVKPGRIIYVITKNTRDAAFFWKSRRDENTMVSVMQNMKQSLLERS